ncbi:hypothetical protein B0J13DRAFT_251942 [Dactylonectria estremocensis]|uniref:Protein kinase domain-containing protein n=1 Tax=Dactylonectria estremocensis TaxID=1079267 RepID=A0A9P9F2H4_9HYPO|nr:hypothetical protein B0J13DRAFT_251942 [Dactylonectria estremocensis]
MSLSERIQWRPPNPNSLLSNFETRCQNAKQQPFLDERLMDDIPSACAWRNFRRPRLRRFKLQGSVNFTKLLGYGLDGIVWKVEIGGCVYALKVFWDNHAPEDTRYWAIQRECQNASLLEMMRFAIEHSSDSIWLNPEPKTFHDAVLNLHAFSDEGRRRQLFRKKPGVVQYSNTPQLRKCHGWTMMTGKELYALPSFARPSAVRVDRIMRDISPSEDYYAIVYEYVSDGQSGLATDEVQAQLDFFWLTGFCLVPLRTENWKGTGILVDMADLVCPWHAAWFPSLYKRRGAREVTQ